MIKFEFKKLFIKQYALVLIVLLVVLKLFSSAELFKPDTSSLSPQQREVYLDYIDKYGGTMTDEKEAEILEKYALLIEANQQMREINNKLNGGEYATTDEYFKAVSELPPIISDSAAIEKLYFGYESVAKDRERRVLLAFDAPAMMVGQEYWLLIFICYISAISVYYERKINNLQKASKSGTKTYAAKLLAVFTAITAVWLIFSVVEFSALTSVISKADLSASLASLESFKETPYPDMTILGGFFAVEAVKLVGYLFTAAVTLIIARLSGNLVLSVFSPVAVNVVWIYLFSNKTAAFYQPFSLMRGAHYLTGTHYISEGEKGYFPEHSEIPGSVLAVLLVIAAAVIILACAMIVSAGKNKLKKHKRLAAVAGITTLTMLLGGCSAERSENCGSAGRIVQIGENYYAAGSNISILDGDLNVTQDRIIRDIFETYIYIGGIFADGNYIYYSAEFNDSSQINRINLTDFSEENVYFGDYSVCLGQTKYFDMITVWSDGGINNVVVKDFFVSGGKIVMSMKSNSVYSLDISTKKMKYLFEDVEVKNLCTSNGMIYYTNLTGELICFDGNEKRTVSDRIFDAVCADESRVYGIATSGVFGYDGEFNETVYSSTSGRVRIRAYDERIAFDTRTVWKYIDENGERDIGEVDDVFVGKNGLVVKNDGKYSFNIVF